MPDPQTKELPLPAATMSRSATGSTPALAPSTSASIVPIMPMNASMLLTSFATLPVPMGPTWNTLAPIESSSGLTSS